MQKLPNISEIVCFAANVRGCEEITLCQAKVISRINSVYIRHIVVLFYFSAVFVLTRYCDLFATAGVEYDSELEYFCTDYRDFLSQVFEVHGEYIGENRKICHAKKKMHVKQATQTTK